METLERILAEHPFFVGLAPEYLALITGCAANARFLAGDFVFREGTTADNFYIIRHGTVDIEIHSPEHGGAVSVQTLQQGEVLGASWLFPPYRWNFDARARTLVRAISLDARCLRTKCDDNPALGYELMKRFSRVIAERLHATRVQLLDVYGRPG